MEKEFIKLIKTTLNSDYIGDDCAYLKDLGIVISQDSLVEEVHFLRDKITPWQLGWKTASVNISDICASGAEPKYMTVALSLPKDINTDFVKEFYDGLKSACADVEIVGGDITGADKIFISATVIGKTAGRNISSRSHAQVGQKIFVSGVHGSSAAGLKLILEGKNAPEKLIKAHLEPVARREISDLLATNQKTAYAMMDTSDGLMDALSQISEASHVQMCVDFDKIPFDQEIKIFPDWRELVLFGGEDYQLLATVDTPPAGATIIGEVKKGSGVNLNGKIFSKDSIEQKLYKHI
ncbi:MAG: thiamine-phosphate kinase [Fusobacterium sp.]|nr:thiamine-phosphate kinase [Fusobacterium sp.]